MTDSLLPVTTPPADAESLLQRISNAYIVLDHEYRFVYANPAAERDMRKSLDEIRGRIHWDVFPASYDITAGQRYRAAAETKVPQHFTQHYHYEGYDIHMEMSAYPTDAGGVAVIWSDVTERVRAEEKLRATENAIRDRYAELDQLYRYAPIGLCTLDRELRFTRCNERLAEINGPSAADHMGKFVWEMVPDLAEGAAALMRRVLETGEPIVDTEVSGETPAQPGVLRYWSASYYPLRADNAEIVGVIGMIVEVTRYRSAEARLRRNEQRYALAARATRNAIRDWDMVRGNVSWSSGLSEIFGWTVYDGDSLEWWLARVHADDRERVAASLRQAISDSPDLREWEASYRFARADGRWADVLDRGVIGRDASGNVVRMLCAMEDVTARRELEDQLRQAQKMEAVGQLAGGVAHDFNNLLTVVMASLDFVRDGLPDDHAVREDLEQIGAAADRARTLVGQLLTFSRKQRVQPRIVNVGDVLRGMERLLTRVIGDEISVELLATSDHAIVCIDPGQLEQVVMNLVVNARDAMLTAAHGHHGKGGAVTIELCERTFDQPTVTNWGDIAPGRYVELRVRDTGHGIDVHTLPHLFEPFFTTKAPGAGTGLGLATVHGIIKLAGGHITVESAPGQGSSFIVLLPAVEPVRREEPLSSRTAIRALAGDTVLVVEDEAPVRTILRRWLELQGAEVLEARHGLDALELWRTHRDRVRLVVTDLRMPELGGRELVEQLRSEQSDVRAVYLSGYADGAELVSPGVRERFVEKPFTGDVLLRAISEVLSEP